MDALVGIIGAGPAGISAAVQLKRYGFEPIILEKRKVGGLIENAHRIDNTMLFPSGLPGPEFVKILNGYVSKYSLNIIKEEVTEIMADEGLTAKTSEDKFEFKYLIVATGTRPRKLNFPGFIYHIRELNYTPSKVLIVGGGDIALDYALSAADMGCEVVVLHRSELKAIPALQREVRVNPRIKLVRGEIVKIGEKIITTAGEFEADALLAAIGRVPNIDIVEGITHPNIYLAGDVKNGMYRQSSLAIADGIRVAMDIWRRERYGNPQGNRR